VIAAAQAAGAAPARGSARVIAALATQAVGGAFAPAGVGAVIGGARAVTAGATAAVVAAGAIGAVWDALEDADSSARIAHGAVGANPAGVAAAVVATGAVLAVGDAFATRAVGLASEPGWTAAAGALAVVGTAPLFIAVRQAQAQPLQGAH